MNNYFLLLGLFLLPLIGTAQTDNLDTFVRSGIELHETGKYKEAIAMYQKGLKKHPDAAILQYEIAYAYMALQDYPQALSYSDKVLKQKDKYLLESFMIKGSALDNMGKTKAAIKAYEKGVKAFPNHYLLRYNLALTHFNNQDHDSAEAELLHAIGLNANHSSSHYLLSFITAEANRRVESILALYFFLFLEPDSGRSENAYGMLNQLWNKGVERESEKKINLTLEMLEDSDEFSSADLMMTLLAAGKTLEKNRDKTEEQLFYENTEAIFSQLAETQEGKTGIWWDLYTRFFNQVAEAGHLEAFCYYITQVKGEAVTTWLDSHADQLEAFGKWLEE